MSVVYYYLGAYVLLLLLVSYFLSRRQSEEDFLIGSRNRGGWQILFTKFASVVGAAYFITYTGFAYEYGAGVFALLIGMVGGYLLFAFWAAPKIYADSKEKKFYTMGDYVYHRTGNMFTLKLTNILSNVIIFFWLLIGIVGGAKIISDFGMMSYGAAVLLTVVVILSYVYLAGYKAVIITDVIQSIIILALLFLVTFSIIGSGSFSSLLAVETGTVGLDVVLGFFLFGLLAGFSFSNLFQLCYAAKTEKKLKYGIGLAIIPILVVMFLLLLLGLFMASNASGLDSGLVFTAALKNFLPASLLPFAIVLFFAGIMSSADTSVYTISSHYVLSNKDRSLFPVKSIRMASIILMIITTTIALIFRDIVDVSILTGGVSLTLSFPMLYILMNGKSSRRFVGSAIGGLIGLVVGVALLGMEPVIALPVLAGGIIGLLWNFGKK